MYWLLKKTAEDGFLHTLKSIIKNKFIRKALTIVAVVFVLNTIAPGHLKIVFLDVGQGDCTFVKTRSGVSVLIDGGRKQ